MVSSLKVEVCKIIEIEKHPNADALDLLHIKGWVCVEKKGRYKVNDLIVYFPPDAVLPVELSDKMGCTQYLSRQRIRPTRLRGVVSCGLVGGNEENWPEGTDLTEHYGVKKWEPPPAGWLTGGQNRRQPGAFHFYTDIENWNNYPDVFEADEEVIMVEKIHGCLLSETSITMSDGSKKYIRNITVGDEVLGVVDGKVVPTKVLNVFNNGQTTQWLNVKGTRRGVGRGGNGYFSVTCTPNHRFWSGNQYVESQMLTPKSPVTVIRHDLGLNPLQEQVILGKLLGDASLRVLPYSASLSFGHQTEYRDYLEWSCHALGELDSGWRGNRVSGFGSSIDYTSSVCNSWMKKLFNDFVDGGKKRVPEWVAEKLGPISLAFWYMDDGSLSHHEDQEDRALFAVCNFTKKDCKILINGLAKFGIHAKYYQSNRSAPGRTHSRLRLNADDAEKLWLLIAPYIPACMQYKLPERYRGHTGWMPNKNSIYKPSIIQQEVISVEPINIGSRSMYDLETKTNNFFANGVLVHNSNFRAGLVENEFLVGSHYNTKILNENVVYWQVAMRYEVERKARGRLPKDHAWVVFGEVYGKRIQDLTYGTELPKLRLFDISMDGQYLNYDDFVALAEDMGLEVAPEIYRGPYDMDILAELCHGSTTLGANHIREGVVIRPVRERYYGKLGRVILKKINPDYLIRRKGTEFK